MKAVIALLLGLVTILSATETETESESPDSVIGWSDSSDDAAPSYGGLSFKVYQSDGEEEDEEGAFTVVLSASKPEKKDKIKRVYCLAFVKTFEATGYVTDPLCQKNCAYTVVEGTEVDLSDANCVITDEGTGVSFDVVCDDISVKNSTGQETGTATLTLMFKYGLYKGEPGLEYTITLADYAMRSESTSFVMQQSITDCTVDYGSDSDDSDSSDEDDNVDSSSAADERRRLDEEADTEEGTDSADDDSNDDEDDEDSADSDSEDESNGVSSDDGNEVDFEGAQYILEGTATDEPTEDCGVAEGEPVPEVAYYPVFQDAVGETPASVQIVFAPFECTLTVDPWFKVDGSRLDDAGNSVQIMSAIVFVSVLAMFVF